MLVMAMRRMTSIQLGSIWHSTLESAPKELLFFISKYGHRLWEGKGSHGLAQLSTGVAGSRSQLGAVNTLRQQLAAKNGTASLTVASPTIMRIAECFYRDGFVVVPPYYG